MHVKMKAFLIIPLVLFAFGITLTSISADGGRPLSASLSGAAGVPNRSGIVAAPPLEPRNRPSGLPPNPFARPPEAAPRISLSLTGDKVEDLVVTAYQHVGLNCLQ